MSLINEALKKAQRERNLGATPTASAPSGIAAAAVTTHVRTASHRSSNAPLWFGLGLLLLGGVVTAVVILFVLNPSPAPASSTATTQPAVAAAPQRPAPTPAAAPEIPLPTITVPSMSAPVAAAAAPTPAPVPAVVIAPPAPPPAPVPAAISTPAPPPAPVAVATAKKAPAPAVAVSVVQPTPAPPPVAVSRVVVNNDAKVYAVLDKLRITGVRGTGIEARVLMNEKVYRINDLIDRELGLRLTEVSSSLLVFVDASGHKYQKPL